MGSIEIGLREAIKKGNDTSFWENDLKEKKEEYEALLSLTEEQYKEELLRKGRMNHLYTVEIPDDNGSNYLDWKEKPTAEQLKRINHGLGDFLNNPAIPERLRQKLVEWNNGYEPVISVYKEDTLFSRLHRD